MRAKPKTKSDPQFRAVGLITGFLSALSTNLALDFHVPLTAFLFGLAVGVPLTAGLNRRFPRLCAAVLGSIVAYSIAFRFVGDRS